MGRVLKLISASIFLILTWAGCPSDWQEVSGSICYYPGTVQITFPQVKLACHSVGGSPAMITDALLNTVIQQYAQFTLGVDQAWIGVEQVDGGYWAYADDAHTNLTYMKWANNEPNNQNYCAAMNSSTGGYWMTRDCSTQLNYFCTRPTTPDVSTTESPLTIPQGNCDQNWKQFSGYCYYLHNFTTLQDGQHWDLFNFTDAEAICETMNSTLASIHNDAENQFLYDLVISNAAGEDDKAYGHPCDWAPAWIGMMHTPDPNGTHWVDGTPVDFCDYPDGCIIAEMYNCGFLIHNDVSCFPTDPKRWSWWVIRAHYSRFVCKKLAMPTNADGFFHGIGYE
ncbi:unnamed protein product, partial [Mesorhabditis belari]|uniref:C-type lectin domain-containing protein n=1 Tax=Mesorhabditis belari TaxID=2138241 RepID=A0AAF3EME4_9BILA